MKLLNLRSRSILLAILSVILALVIVGRLYYLQILRGEDFTQSFEESVTRTVSIPAKRGRILDRNGAVIADTAASMNRQYPCQKRQDPRQKRRRDRGYRRLYERDNC